MDSISFVQIMTPHHFVPLYARVFAENHFMVYHVGQ